MKPQDMPENYYFGGGGDTLITPLGLGMFLLAAGLMLALPRKYVIVPFLLAGLLVPVQQQLVVLSAHLMIYRLLILVGWTRMAWFWVATRTSPFPHPLGSIDKFLCLWALSTAVMYTILWHEPAALINRVGFLYSTLGAYFLLRYLVRDREDVMRSLKVLAVLVMVVAVGMWGERLTGRNLFSAFGGVAEYSDVRDGSVRAQGPFLHSIIAGTVGAMLAPLMFALGWCRKNARWLAALGLVGCTLMTIASASSTPVMTYGAGVVGLLFWRLRYRMRTVRWVAVLGLILLQVAMKAPIWFLMARLGGVLGGTGWHRAFLMDQFIRRFGEWWLVGTQNNAAWGIDMWDAINAYVTAGIQGGLLTFLLFIALLTTAFKTIGVASWAKDPAGQLDKRLIWAIGTTVFANTVAFLGITYFDQSVLAWYALLVMASAATAVALPRNRAALQLDGVGVESPLPAASRTTEVTAQCST